MTGGIAHANPIRLRGNGIHIRMQGEEMQFSSLSILLLLLLLLLHIT